MRFLSRSFWACMYQLKSQTTAATTPMMMRADATGFVSMKPLTLAINATTTPTTVAPMRLPEPVDACVTSPELTVGGGGATVGGGGATVGGGGATVGGGGATVGG